MFRIIAGSSIYLSLLFFVFSLAGCQNMSKKVEKAGKEVKQDFKLDSNPDVTPQQAEDDIERHGEP